MLAPMTFKITNINGDTYIYIHIILCESRILQKKIESQF